ncbi:hypothetical protein HGRIS_004033 [Hohenbuehelia grisea]|uniref:Uncharacterized protein n=1 Tax=Hohenbuehelia grisea TaxID=104357 RepID=A0ABR3JHW7_9AGAR
MNEMLKTDIGPFLDIPSITSMLTRSQCRLQELYISCSALPNAHALELLQQTTNLVTLKLYGLDPINTELLNALTFHPDQPLMPALEHVELCGYMDNGGPDQGDALMTFLESRPSLKFARIAISTEYLVSPSRAYRLEQLVDAGLEFEAVAHDDD